jgi:hypothetical protein
VVAVAESVFGEHKLELVEVKKSKGRGKSRREWVEGWRVVPRTTWEDAAREIIQTINGVGYFHFGSLKEACASGPYTTRQFVLAHTHWIPSWFEVYGEGKAANHVDRACRR